MVGWFLWWKSVALCFPIIMGVCFVRSFLCPVPIRHFAAAIGLCEVLPRPVSAAGTYDAWLGHDIGMHTYTGNALSTVVLLCVCHPSGRSLIFIPLICSVWLCNTLRDSEQPDHSSIMPVGIFGNIGVLLSPLCCYRATWQQVIDLSWYVVCGTRWLFIQEINFPSKGGDDIEHTNVNRHNMHANKKSPDCSRSALWLHLA